MPESDQGCESENEIGVRTALCVVYAGSSVVDATPAFTCSSDKT